MTEVVLKQTQRNQVHTNNHVNALQYTKSETASSRIKHGIQSIQQSTQRPHSPKVFLHHRREQNVSRETENLPTNTIQRETSSAKKSNRTFLFDREKAKYSDDEEK